MYIRQTRSPTTHTQLTGEAISTCIQTPLKSNPKCDAIKSPAQEASALFRSYEK